MGQPQQLENSSEVASRRNGARRALRGPLRGALTFSLVLALHFFRTTTLPIAICSGIALLTLFCSPSSGARPVQEPSREHGAKGLSRHAVCTGHKVLGRFHLRPRVDTDESPTQCRLLVRRSKLLARTARVDRWRDARRFCDFVYCLLYF